MKPKLINKIESRHFAKGKYLVYGLFQCPSCDNTFECPISHVNTNRKRNCGCRIAIDVEDNVNGINILQDLGVINGRRNVLITCTQDGCINTYAVIYSSLKAGKCKLDCGCKKNTPKIKENKVSNKPVSIRNHSLYDDKLYYTWKGMKRRCYSKTHPKYIHYGARGITVCNEWRNSYIQFATDMGAKQHTGLSLDRIDNNKGYYKENCRWATCKEQNNNKRNNKLYI